jgi:ATP-binding cassette subfamily A (ABC1) protein 3
MQAIVELRTGQTPPTPLEWPFTQETNAEQSTNTRLRPCFFTFYPLLSS